MSRFKNLIHEIHRRSLWQVLAIYVVGAWIGYEVIQSLTEGLGLPAWFPAFAVILFIIGLPIVLATAFIQEGVTPGRAESAGRAEPAPAPAPVPASAPTGADADGVSPAGTQKDRAARRLFTWRRAIAGGVLAFALWGVIAAGWLLVVGPTSEAPTILARRMTPLTETPGLEAAPDWSPDGASIVFVSEQSGNRDIWIRSVSGRQETQVTSDPAEDAQPAWSPDGRRIAFVSSRGYGIKLDQNVLFGYSLGGAIWIVPAFGGPPSKVLDGGFHPDWSPDGERLAFDASFDGSRRIWSAAADGPTPQRISSDDAEAAIHTHPKWSPNGRWIVYQRQEHNVTDIQVVPSGGGGAAIWITQDDANDLTPTWMPDGRAIVFASDRGGPINLWMLAVDPGTGEARGEPSQITAGSEQYLFPSVAPDGRSLAHTSLRVVEDLWWVETDPRTGAWVAPPAPLLTSSRSDNQPAMAPDGSAVVFSSDRSGDIDLWTLQVGETTPKLLTDVAGSDMQADWSLDGKNIAFFSNRAGDEDIWVVPAGGGPAIQLTDSPANEMNPYWSPDGSQIAFMSDASGRSEVWVMETDGSTPRQLTDIGATGHTARWSPDGEWLLFTSLAGGDRNVWAVSSRGGEPRRLTAESTQEAHGLWTADGKTVLYLTDHRSLRAIPFDGGEPTLLFDAGPGERIDYVHLSRDGRHLLFTFQRTEGDLWLIEATP